MPASAQASAEPVLPEPQAIIPARAGTPERRMADAIRTLAIDCVHAARSGDATMPIGMAEAATVLWTRFHKFDAADPSWPDRDRFVLSDGHGAMLLYSLLHLTGHAGMELDALKQFRQLHSPAAGHPEYGGHPGIEATTGPLGQGLATAVGMALAERMLAARFGKSLVDHRTWVIASNVCLMEGLSHEAISLAGRLRLDRLTVLWDNNSAPNDTTASVLAGDEQLKRFAASGWTVKRVDAHDAAQLGAALGMAVRAKKPTLIACSTPAAATETQAASRAVGGNHARFEVPEAIAERWRAAGTRGAAARRSWLKRLTRHPLRTEFERMIAGRLPDRLHETIAALKANIAERKPELAGCHSSQMALDWLEAALPELVGGAADLTGSHLTSANGTGVGGAGNFAGRHIDFGIRKHGMAAAMNGIALHGGLIPYAATFCVFADDMRPALRLAAMMRRRVIHVLTHDSIGAGEEGPTLQPVEHLASLRAMPGMHVLRPACAMEAAECWELAIRRLDGPSVLMLSRQDLPSLRGACADTAENRCARGGYVLAEADGPRLAILIASGSEVAVAMAARSLLAADGIPVAVISLPCWELFAQQDAGYRELVLGGAPRFGIEAAVGFGWERWLGPEGTFIGMTGFGASAPCEALYRHFGITAEAVAAAVRRRLAGEAVAPTTCRTIRQADRAN